MLFMATVDEARQTNEGPFRAIAPLFRIALEPQQGQILNFVTAARTLQSVLGDGFNVYAVEAFAPQLAALGWLVEERTASGVAYRVATTLGGGSGDEAVEASSQKLDRLYDAFATFLEGSAPLFKFELSKDEFKWQLFRWATSLDGSDKAHILEHAKALEEGRTPSVRDAYLDEPQRFSKIERTISVEFAGFVKWLELNGRDEIRDIASLTELGLALEFIEELQTPTARDGPNISTTFVLDAPVLLDLMGLSGPARKKSLKTYLDLLRERGGKIVTLSHNLEEMAEIINTVLARPNSQRFGLTGDALRQDPALESVARGVAQSPDLAARTMEVEVLTFDPASPLNQAAFSDQAIDEFRSSATWHTDMSKSEQKYRDALSVAFVMRRRNRVHNSDVLDCPYVLITRNSTFTRFAELFCQRKIESPDYAFGPAIEIKTLAAFLWMRFGSEVNRDLPQMQLVAACDRILASNGEIMRKAERKLRELSGGDATLAILNSRQAVLDLVVATGGNADVIDGADGDQIIRALTSSAEARGREIERKLADEAQAKLGKQLEDAVLRAEQTNAEKLALAADALAKQGLLRKTEEELERRDRADRERALGVATRLHRGAKTFAKAVVVLMTAITIGTALTGQLFIWRGLDWWTASLGNLAVGVVVVLATFAAAAAGVEFMGNQSLTPQAWARAIITKGQIRAALWRIADHDERARVKVALESLGAL